MHIPYQTVSLAYVLACVYAVFPISGLKNQKGTSDGFRSCEEM